MLPILDHSVSIQSLVGNFEKPSLFSKVKRYDKIQVIASKVIRTTETKSPSLLYYVRTTTC